MFFKLKRMAIRIQPAFSSFYFKDLCKQISPTSCKIYIHCDP